MVSLPNMRKLFFRKRTPDVKGRDSAASNPSGSERSGPGATNVDHSNTSVFRVTVPEGVEPGQEFQVYAGNRIVRVRCPPGCGPGQSLQITVPVENLTASAPNLSSTSSSTTPPDSPNVERLDEDPPAYMVTIPEGTQSEQQFPVTIAGQQLMVTCPAGAGPGAKVRIVPPQPPPPEERPSSNLSSSMHSQPPAPEPKKEEAQLFEVQVPEGVQPGQPFALLAGGVRVLVTCPVNAGPGQRIRFKLPLALTQKPAPRSEAAAIKLSYDKDGWTRTIRVSDMKFQWVRMDDKGDIENELRFDAEKSAYVRKIDFRPGSDTRIRDGVLSLVPANQAFVNSSIKGAGDEDLVTYSDIAEAQGKTFNEKAEWFQEKCRLFGVDYSEGYIRINLRREFLLEDSVDAVMSLSRRDLRKAWRFEFIGEKGIDAGGLAREWFQLVSEETFDPEFGLWQSSEANQMCMQINPASSKYRVACYACLLVGLLLPPVSHQVSFATTISFTIAFSAASWARPSLMVNSWRVTRCSTFTSTCWAGQSCFATWKWSTRSITTT